MYDPVTYYLHLRAQSIDHDAAAAHTIQRFGINVAVLGAALREARESMEHDLALLPKWEADDA